MQLHNLKPKTKLRHGKRVGRGGKRGTTSGRGTKGQKARAGHKIRPADRDILKRIPKLRGYKFKSFWPKPRIVNFYDLERKFKNGDTVSPETLLKAGLVSRIKGRIPEIKILGKGDLIKNLVFKDIDFSNKARLKIGSQETRAVSGESLAEKKVEKKPKQSVKILKKKVASGKQIKKPRPRAK